MKINTIGRYILWLLCLLPLTNSAAGFITVSTNPVVAGCSVTFICDSTGPAYEWSFGAGAMVPSLNGSNYQTAQTVFKYPGQHEVIVNVLTTSGWISDTIQVNVTANTINVTLAHNIDTVCAGTAINYTAAPSGYLQYHFFVNDIAVQISASRNFTATNLQPGDSVVVYVFDGSCYSNSSPAHYPVIKTIPPPVTVTDSDTDDTICGGDLITFTANPPGYDEYIFYNGGSPLQNSAQNTFTTTQLGQGNFIYVIVTNNGCTSGWSNVDSIYVMPNPLANTNLTSTACEGYPVTVSATPTPLQCDWELNGQLIQSGTQLTLNTDTLQAGDQLRIYFTLDGCRTLWDTIEITINSNPEIPVISTSGNILTSSLENSYRWYLDSNVIINATQRSYTAIQSGNYMVQVFNADGCSAFSNPVDIQVTGIENVVENYGFKIISIANKNLTVYIDRALTGTTAGLYNMSGHQIQSVLLSANQLSIDCSTMPTGMYIFKAGNSSKKIVLE